MLVPKSGPRPCRDDGVERSESAKKRLLGRLVCSVSSNSGGTALSPVEKRALPLSPEFKRALSRMLVFKSSHSVTINDLLLKVLGETLVLCVCVFADVFMCGEQKERWAYMIVQFIVNVHCWRGQCSLAYGERLEVECNIKLYSKAARRNTLSLKLINSLLWRNKWLLR